MTAIRRSILDLDRNGIAAVSQRGLGQRDIIPLWFGESDVVTPEFIRAGAKKALDDGRTFYTFARGIPELREAIAAWTTKPSYTIIPTEDQNINPILERSNAKRAGSVITEIKSSHTVYMSHPKEVAAVIEAAANAAP